MSTFPGAFLPVAPPADGLRLAFVAARRRRNTKAGAAGAAGLLTLVMALASLGGAGNRTLLQQPLPPARGGATTLITGLQPSPDATEAPAGGELGTAAAGAGARPPARGQLTVTSPTTVSAATGATARRAATRRPVSGPMSRSDYVT